MAQSLKARSASAVLAVMTLAGCMAAPGAVHPSALPAATDPAPARERAQTVLSAWSDAAAAAGEHAAVTPVGELTGQVGDWEEAVGDNNKRALMAGLVGSVSSLSEDAPPDGEVVWHDGTTTTVPLLSANAAFVAIETTTAARCSDCAMLLVTAARLTSVEAPRYMGVDLPPFIRGVEERHVAETSAAIPLISLQ